MLPALIRRTCACAVFLAAAAGATDARAGVQATPDLSADVQWIGGPRRARATPPSEVGLVFVEVAVTDPNGSPVTGLPREAFDVAEDRVRQRVVSFRPVDIPGPAGPEPSESRAPARVTSNTDDEPAPPRRTFVVVYDDLHLGPAEGRRGREATQQFLEHHARPDDQVILVIPGQGFVSVLKTPGGPTVLADVPALEGRRPPHPILTDFEALRIVENRDGAVEDRVRRRWREAGTPPSTGSPNVRAEARQVLEGAGERRRRALGSLAAVLDVLTTSRTRKSVLLVSAGFIHDPGDRLSYDAIAASQRANAAIYFLDVRRPALGSEVRLSGAPPLADESTGAEILATLTGGDVIPGREDVNAALRRVSQETSHHYLLGYLPPTGPGPGRLRRISVNVNRPGVTVRARKGYWEGSVPGAVPKEEGLEALDLPLREALLSPALMRQIPVRLTALPVAPADGGRVEVAIASETSAGPLRLRPEPDGSRGAALEVTMKVSHVHPEASAIVAPETITARVPEGARAQDTWVPRRWRVTLPPGLSQFKVVVRDPVTGAIGTVVYPLEVPDPRELRHSAPILSDVREGPEVTPPRIVARRSFAPGSVLYCYFEVFPEDGVPTLSDSGDHVPAYEIVDRRGRVRRRAALPLPVPSPHGNLARLVEIPLARIEPGDYELVLDLGSQPGRETTELREPFSVARPARFTDELYRGILTAYVEGDVQSAVANLVQWSPEEILKAAESLPRNGDRLAKTALLLHTDVALLLRRHGLEKQAESHLTIGRTLLEGEPPELHRQWLLALAYVHQVTARPAEALSFYTECSRAFPEGGEARMGAGTLYERIAFFPAGFGRGNLFVTPRVAARAAEGSYREALRIEPSLTEARLRLARVLQKTDRVDEAVEELSRVVESSDNTSLTALAHLFWGEIAQGRGDVDEAVRHYRAAQAADTNLQAAALALAQALYRRDGRRAAVKVLVPALEKTAGPSPWWAYRQGPLRLAPAPLDALRARLAAGVGGSR